MNSFKIDDLEKALKLFKDRGAKEVKISKDEKQMEISALGGDTIITISMHWEHNSINMYKPPKITETKPL